MNGEMKAVGYAIYAPPALRKFLEARATGNVSKELLTELSEAAMREQFENKPLAPVIDFASARRERTENT